MSWEFVFLAIQLLYLHDRAECEVPGGSTSGIFKKWVKENLPDIQKDYNPNHGFEPYWPGGDWLFKDPQLGPNETTTKVPLVCGEECNYLYTRVGAVCARQVHNMDHVQCFSFFGLFCIAGKHDEFQRGFQTFDTYCKFLDAQCRSVFTERWILVHEGECSHDIDSYFKPINDTKQPKNRLSGYFEKLANTYGNAGLPHPLRHGPDTPLHYLENRTEIDIPQALHYNGPVAHPSSAGKVTLPYTLRQHIHNVVKDMFFGNHDDD